MLSQSMDMVPSAAGEELFSPSHTVGSTAVAALSASAYTHGIYFMLPDAWLY